MAGADDEVIREATLRVYVPIAGEYRATRFAQRRQRPLPNSAGSRSTLLNCEEHQIDMSRNTDVAINDTMRTYRDIKGHDTLTSRRMRMVARLAVRLGSVAPSTWFVLQLDEREVD